MTNENDSNRKNSTKAMGANDFVTEAYNVEDPDSLRAFYSKWAGEYDNQMTELLNYHSPHAIAHALQHYLKNKEAKIIDIGCGTGLTAMQMSIAGYSRLFGIDLSPEMVEVATGRGIYEGLKVGDVNDALDYEDDTFDGAISSGTFTHGHVGAEPLVEIFRIIKPNGFLACTVHLDLWHSRGFDQKFQQLQDDGIVRCQYLEHDLFYKDDPESKGWFCVYQKIGN